MAWCNNGDGANEAHTREERDHSPQLPKGVKEGDKYEDMRREPNCFIWYFFYVLDDDLWFWWPDGDGDDVDDGDGDDGEDGDGDDGDCNDGDGDVGDCGGLDELFMAPPPPIPCLSHLTPDSTFDNHHDFEERRFKWEIGHPPLNKKKVLFFSIFGLLA